MRVYRLLVMRSFSTWAAVLGGVASLVYLMTHKGWAGEWQGGVQAATGCLALALPGVILAGGLDAGRYVRETQVSAVDGARPAAMLAVVMAASLTAPLLMVLTLLMSTFGVNATISRFHFPGVLPLLLPFAVTAAYVAIGFVLGRWLVVVLLVPLAAVLGFLVPVVLSSTSDGRAGLWSPLDNAPAAPPSFLRAETVAGQILICGVILLGCMTVLVQQRHEARSRRVRTGSVAVMAVVALAGLTVTVDPQRHYEATAAEGPSVCQDGDLTEVCTWPDHSPLLDPAVAVGDRVSATLSPFWPDAPPGYVEQGLAAPASWGTFGNGATRSTDRAIAPTIAAATVDVLVCGDGGESPRFTRPVAAREEWLLAETDFLTDRLLTHGTLVVRERPVGRQRSWWLDVPERTAATCS